MTKHRKKKVLKKEEVAPPIAPKNHRVSLSARARFLSPPPTASHPHPFRLYKPPPGVVPEKLDNETRIAMDDAISDINIAWSWAGSVHGEWAEGIGFMGYPYLAELSQRSEYRQPCEVMAEEMTRKWITIKASSDDEDKSDKIKELTDAIKEFKLRDIVKHAILLDGFYGMSFIQPDIVINGTPVADDDEELLTEWMIDKSKIPIGSLRGFNVIEPMWMSANAYNTLNPMDPTFYIPTQWFVMGRRVHTTRLFKVCMRPVPDMLKPAYNFGGLSLTQMMKPYVDNWLRTRQSVADLVNAFTIWTLMTNMQATLQEQGSGEDIDSRLSLFAAMKNNRGVFAIDRDTEQLENISAPIGGLSELQAQAQEQMAAPARIPLVKMFGITPSGLNASTDGEISTFYDTIHGMQEASLGDTVTKCLEILQLHLWGAVDPEIIYEFNPLKEMTELETATVRKLDADTDTVYIQAGAIDSAEVRQRIADDPKSLYHGLEGPPPEPDFTDEFGNPIDQIPGPGDNPGEGGGGSESSTE